MITAPSRSRSIRAPTNPPQYELFYARQSTVLRGDALAPVSIDVEYLHIGGTVALDEAQAREALPCGRSRDHAPSARILFAVTKIRTFRYPLALGLRVPPELPFLAAASRDAAFSRPGSTRIVRFFLPLGSERCPLPGAGGGVPRSSSSTFSAGAAYAFLTQLCVR